MTARRPRGRLTEEDRQLWTHVTRDVRPRRSTKPPAMALDPAPAETPAAPVKTAKVRPITRPSSVAVSASPAQPGHSGLDGRRDERFRKGELEIEARLDLHGLTLERAHAALIDFLIDARRRGLRVVLVITGKGAGGDGAIRRFTPRWLAEPPYARLIAATAPARPHHGGAGALYVYLRRMRP